MSRAWRDWREDMIPALEKKITFLQGLVDKYKRELRKMKR